MTKLDVPVRRRTLAVSIESPMNEGEPSQVISEWVALDYVEALEAFYLQAKKDASEVVMARHYLSHTRIACSVWREAAQKFRNLFLFTDEPRLHRVGDLVGAIENFDEVERIADDLDRIRKKIETDTAEIVERLEAMREPDEFPEFGS